MVGDPTPTVTWNRANGEMFFHPDVCLQKYNEANCEHSLEVSLEKKKKKTSIKSAVNILGSNIKTYTVYDVIKTVRELLFSFHQFPKVAPEDADTYKCYATNEYGRAVCTVLLNVIESKIDWKSFSKSASINVISWHSCKITWYQDQLCLLTVGFSKTKELQKIQVEGEVETTLWQCGWFLVCIYSSYKLPMKGKMIIKYSKL